MMIRITRHAVRRAMQRIPGLKSETEAVRILSSKAVNCAASFMPRGSIWVKIPTGQHIALQDSHVVTVLPAELDMRKMSSEAERYRHFCRAYEIAHWTPEHRDPAAMDHEGVGG